MSAEEAKSCCAAAYGNDAVALVLGESYHPGGLSLTRRLAQRLGLRSGLRVLDVAAGRGATARLLAAEFDVVVDGIDRSEPVVEKARASATGSGMGSTLRFQVGDAERIPMPDGSFDAALCECAFCTFPDKATAALEIARVLRPGGRLGITDVTVTDKGLPDELTTVAAWVSCIADAKPLEQYVQVLAGAGLRTVHREPHDYAISRMIDQIVARVRLLRMTAPDQLAATGVDVDAVLRYCALARQAVDDGLIGYALLIAEKPHQRTPTSGTGCGQPAGGIPAT